MYYKIILLGEPRVGKTTLRRAYMGNSLNENYVKTIGFDFSIKKIGDGAFQIWDIAGQSTDNTLRAYIDGTSAAILVFDVMSKPTLLELKRWLNVLVSTLEEIIPVVVVGNKIDLRDSEKGMTQNEVEVEYNELIKLVESTNAQYIETSALTGENVEMVFEWLYKTLSNMEG